MQRRWTSEIGEAKREKKSESRRWLETSRVVTRQQKTPYLKHLFWGWPRSLSPRAYTYHERGCHEQREREREEAKEEGSVTRFAWGDSSKTNHHALCCAVACWKPRWILADVRPFDVTDKSGVINGANANFTAVPWNWNGCRSPKSGRSIDVKHADVRVR